MIRAGLISVFFILWVHICFSQDRLIKMDGTELNVRIIEVNPASVRYASPEDPLGPQMVISKKVIYKIIFENGTEVTLGRLDSQQDNVGVPEQNYFYPNHFNFVVSDLIYGMLTASYENIFLQGKMGLRFSGSLGIVDAENWYYGRKVSEGILSAQWYPFGHEKITSYFGISLVRGTFQSTEYYYSDFDYYEEKISKGYGAFSFDYGARYTSKNGFVAGASTGIGYLFSPTESVVYFPLKLRIGYAF